MVRKSNLERFIQKGGYDIVKQDSDGSWKGISEAMRATGLSRPTIYLILKKNPEQPEKGQPKYVQELAQSEGFKKFKLRYGGNKNFKAAEGVLRKAFVYLQKKDPIDWNLADYEKLWHPDSPFFNATLGGVPEQYGIVFRNLMKASRKLDFLQMFHCVKHPKGSKKEWFLESEEIIRILGKFETNDCVMMFYLGIVKGARFSSLVEVKPDKMSLADWSMNDFEKKMLKKRGKAYVTRYIPEITMNLVQRYIKDYNIKGDEPLFTQSYSVYLDLFKAAGRAAGINKTISTHIMKHTFVTQAARHGVSAEVITEQTGTDWGTLETHYKALNPAKLRFELQGVVSDKAVVDFVEWIRGLHPYFVEAYERIQKHGGGLKLNGKT